MKWNSENFQSEDYDCLWSGGIVDRLAIRTEDPKHFCYDCGFPNAPKAICSKCRVPILAFVVGKLLLRTEIIAWIF